MEETTKKFKQMDLIFRMITIILIIMIIIVIRENQIKIKIKRLKVAA